MFQNVEELKLIYDWFRYTLVLVKPDSKFIPFDFFLNKDNPTVDGSLIFSIQKGRHPVVDILLKTRNDVSFVPNNCLMDDETKLLLLTGPNMAGKSTYLRQNAFIHH